MIDTGCALESLAMRSSEAATGTRTTTQACSISTTTGPTTTTTTSASADPTLQRLDAGLTATEGSILVESIPQVTAKARQQAKPKTAAAPTGAVAEHGKLFSKIKGVYSWKNLNLNYNRKSQFLPVGNQEQLLAEQNIALLKTATLSDIKPQMVEPLKHGGQSQQSSQTNSDFFKITSMDNLYSCWLKAKRNKGSSLRMQRFESDALSYLTTIQQRLRSRIYTFGEYKTFTVRKRNFVM